MIRAITSARGKPAIEDKNHLSNAVGRDLTSNSGRRQASKDAKERIKWLIDHFRTTPEKEYILTMAHELMKSYSSGNLH